MKIETGMRLDYWDQGTPKTSTVASCDRGSGRILVTFTNGDTAQYWNSDSVKIAQDAPTDPYGIARRTKPTLVGGVAID